MIKLIQRYPLISSLLGLVILGLSIFIYRQLTWQTEWLAELPEASTFNVSSQNEQAVLEEEVERPAGDKQPEMATVVEEQEQPLVPAIPEQVPVYICGEVNIPGVYYVPATAIIDDVIRKCGGFTPTANETAVNLASPIVPHAKIVIPAQGEQIDKLVESYDNIEGNERIEQKVEAASTMININTADSEALKALPGIGDVKAAAIIAYREANGGFESKEEIKNVTGIGDKTYEKLAPLITT